MHIYLKNHLTLKEVLVLMGYIQKHKKTLARIGFACASCKIELEMGCENRVGTK